MPRDWTREERSDRRERWDERQSRPEADDLEDFGLADYSTDYGYEPRRRTGYRIDEEASRRADDYGQADYSTDFVYDRDGGRAYRRYSAEERDYRRAEPSSEAARRAERAAERDEDLGERNRSWKDRAGAFFGGRDQGDAVGRRRGPSDRVLWAVIVERLEDERGLDLRDVEVLVDDCDVTLNGTVRRKEDKRRIEDIADIEGVRNVQNNLRLRDHGRRWF
jgi:osmotically-inducible protein OsmY